MRRVLAIESSCDETAVALLETDGVRVRIKKNLVTSQVPIHQKYGGVVPEVAARSHVPEAVALVTKAFGRGTAAQPPFDAIAVTAGPGLATALRVGIEAARVLAFTTGKPLVAVNHLEGHLASAWLSPENRKRWQFPLLALVVSGGHTELVLMKDFGVYEIVGQTRDDAAGEAFDKTAKLMGLPYPGGPQIAKLALRGEATAFVLPRPMKDDGTFDFSFSGLKTAVRQVWEGLAPDARQVAQPDLAASVQEAIVDVLVAKTVRCAAAQGVRGVLLVGGVSANLALRERLGQVLQATLPGVAFLPSDRRFITDNAAMIAAAGAWRLARGEQDDWRTLDADPEANLG
jgi:N6-L-threonylcarbamoyladenine synthase